MNVSQLTIEASWLAIFGDLDELENDLAKSVTREDTTPNRPLWSIYYRRVFKPFIHYTDPKKG